MARYDVYVQGKFYKTIEAPYTNNVLTQVTLDLADGLVPDYDETKPQNIELRKPEEAAPASDA
jgi:hypothetical protein